MQRGSPDDDPDDERHTRGLLALAFMLLLALAAGYLFQSLRREGRIEDCLLQQRIDCDTLLEEGTTPVTSASR